MEKRSRLALHPVTVSRGEFVRSGDRRPFDARGYSRFKYGDRSVARLYGFGLAELLAETHPDIIFGNEPVAITGSSMKNIERSSHAIAAAFQEAINYMRMVQGLPSTDRFEIRQSHHDGGDYGTFSAEERQANMDRITLFADKKTAEGKHLLVIDDVIITGANERKLDTLIDSLGVLSVQYLYAVQLDTAAAAADPTLEDKLNHAQVKTLTDLAAIIATRDFLMNTRVYKFVLQQKDPEQVVSFVSGLNNESLYRLYVAAVGDGYVFLPEYQGNSKIVETEMEKRGLITDGKLQHLPEEI